MDAVVITHNSAADLEGLLGCEPARRAFDRIIVVDNDSTDGTVDLARGEDDVETLERGSNDGFAAAANAGAELTRGPDFCVLNPDIHLRAERDVDLLRANLGAPQVGLVAPALELPDGTIQDSARRVPTPFELVWRRVANTDRGAIRTESPANVPWVVGAFMLIRRSAFDAIGGFDTGYHLYFEDVDFCVRMRSAGWAVRLEPRIVADHRHRAASRRSYTGWANRQHVRSAARFFARHPHHLLRRPREWAAALRTRTRRRRPDVS
jgi:GT2 family glycosyltransferase